MTRSLKVLGLMSGSSLDGLDMALCEFSGSAITDMQWICHAAKTEAFPDELRSALARCTELSVKTLKEMEVAFTDFCVTAIKELDRPITEIDYVAHHGHTVLHFPHNGYSLQIINGAQLSIQTGLPSIIDFRSQDIALGGQGAPIAPIVEKWLLSDYRLFLNLGGIANISCHTDEAQIIAYDVCPCNQTLNSIVQELNLPFDKGGQLASRGKLIPEFIDKWDRLQYFQNPYPKSLDNNWCRDNFTSITNNHNYSIEDRLFTAVDFITSQISSSFIELVNSKSVCTESIYVTGGGAYNTFLIEMLNSKLKPNGLSAKTGDDEMINYKEAILMALMGYLRVNNIPNTIPSVTGANKSTISGAIYIP